MILFSVKAVYFLIYMKNGSYFPPQKLKGKVCTDVLQGSAVSHCPHSSVYNHLSGLWHLLGLFNP
jgi:hypothetical protein